MSNSDAVLIVTGHKQFDDLNMELLSNSMNEPILVDCTGKVDPNTTQVKGIIFRGIGRGNAI